MEYFDYHVVLCVCVIITESFFTYKLILDALQVDIQ